MALRVIDNVEEKTRGAYTAYARATGGKNFQGNDMPVFDALPPKIRGAWEAAVISVCIAEQDEAREKKIGTTPA